MEKTSWKEMSEELKQLDSLTSATSAGSANSMSTHWLLKNQNSVSYLIFLWIFGCRGFLEKGGKGGNKWTYVVQCGSVDSRLDDLDGRLVTWLDGGVGW